MKNYNKKNIPLAKNLRKNMTPWERKLWYEFLRTYPIRFQRQKAIGNYIVDFYCAKVQLVVELDGGGHFSNIQSEKDANRTDDLEKMGLTVLRICNNDVDKNFEGVCEYIDLQVKNLSLSHGRSHDSSLVSRQRQPITPCGVLGMFCHGYCYPKQVLDNTPRGSRKKP